MASLLPARPRRAIGLVFFVALVVRAVCLAQFARSPLANVLVSDGASYDAWAQRIVAGDWIGHAVFYQTPLYPYLLAVLYSGFGRSLLVVRLAQCVTGAVAAAMLVPIGRRLGLPRAGLVGGLMLAVYPPAIFFDLLVQKASLDLFLVTILFWLVAPGERWRPWLRAAAAGIVAGLLCLNRENALLLLLAIPIWWALDSRRGRLGRRVSGGLCFLGGAALALLPVGIRNDRVGGEFIITTSQLGTNFYYGNGGNATGLYRSLRAGRGDPLFERTDAREIAERETGRSLAPDEVSGYWMRRTLRDIGAAPGRWIRLIGRKALLIWNDRELPDSECIEAFADESPLLRVLSYVMRFGLIAALAAGGACLAWPMRRDLIFAYLLLFIFGGTTILFFAFARYRHPMMPAMMLLAGAGLARGWEIVHSFADRSSRRRFLLAAGAGALSAAIAFAPVAPREDPRVETYNNYGMVLALTGEQSDAINLFSRAVRIDPADALSHNNLGLALAADGRMDDALKQFREAIRLRPDLFRAHRNLGTALRRLGRLAESERAYEDALAIEPGSAEVQRLLAEIRRELGGRPIQPDFGYGDPPNPEP